jgi:rod shape-determining protein MreD
MTLIMVLIVILQSTLFNKLPGNFIFPDFTLVIIVFFSNGRGRMDGQISGFFTGMAEDFLSLSPPGFNSLIKTLIGYIYGSLKGKIFIDPIFFPVIMVMTATLLKAFSALLISALFLKPEAAPAVFTARFAIEMAENCIAAPFVFALMKTFKFYSAEERGF